MIDRAHLYPSALVVVRSELLLARGEKPSLVRPTEAEAVMVGNCIVRSNGMDRTIQNRGVMVRLRLARNDGRNGRKPLLNQAFPRDSLPRSVRRHGCI